MIILIHGNSFERVKKKTDSILDSLQRKRPQAEILSFDEETLNRSVLEECIQSRGLFERKLIVVLRGVLTSKNTRDDVLALLKEIEASENVFVFSEKEKILQSLVKKVTSRAQVVYKEEKESLSNKPFSPFAMTDAFGQRDIRKAWVLYQEALYRGSTNEELSGILFWQTKNLIIAKNAKSSKESGLKPFVYTKSKKLSENFTTLELLELSSLLLENYHEARRGNGKTDLKIEHLLLNL